jgi:phage gpG-like protein
MSIRFRVTLDDEPRRLLAAAAARGEDMRPALRAMGQAGVAQTQRRFVTKRAPDGSAWRPTDKPSGSTMIASGLLLRSISARPPSDTAVEWGSNRVYAAIRQLGGIIRAKGGGYLRFRVGANGGWVARKEVRQHARPYLGVNDQDMAEFAAIGLRHVAGPLGGR